ncbi:MAG: GNAT family N-acetyltransferase [Tannerella sp.]|jgi:ribosomal protein S18 acetylase RimI-like enzyme|nr:GNAT family N-acetyltransferase [Tannerella sp.]
MFIIRKATGQDAGRIHFLASQVFQATYREILSPEQLDYMFEWMYAPDQIRKQMDDGQAYMILSKDGEDVGYAAVEKQEENLFHLQKIYILPVFQGCHAGRFLFDEVVKYIREVHPGPCVLELNVNRYNKAVHFYKRMGMSIDRQGDFPIGNGYYMNDYIMKMEIG